MLSPQRILKLSQHSASRSRPIEFTPIDHARPFMHESFTQLFYTPLYASLSDSQRLRYNQLCGLCGNELFMQFETGFTQSVMTRLARHPLVSRDPALLQCLRIMLDEELAHSAMFGELNRRCMPRLYPDCGTYFTRLSLVERLLLWGVTRFPQHLIFLIWLVLIIEEHSNQISKRVVTNPVTDSLGGLEPNFVEIHRRHLRDESRHVHIDARLLELFSERAGRRKRKANALALRRLLLEIVTPKRAALAVIRELVRQCPELGEDAPRLQAAVRALEIDPGFAMTLARSRESPLTALLLDSYPEFHFSINGQG